MLLIRLGLDDGSLVQNPDYILDPTEVQAIQQRVDIFNQIIGARVSATGMPVVDINTLFDSIHENPPVFFDIPLTTGFLGGLFSLDGVHPSNIGHALVADAFIAKINDHFITDIPSISPWVLDLIFLTDPSIDKDSDSRATGRAGMGFLETIGPVLGISGDLDDFTPYSFREDPYYGPEDKTVPNPDSEDVISAFKQIFGLKIPEKKKDEELKHEK
jgi:hypothetical protein